MEFASVAVTSRSSICLLKNENSSAARPLRTERSNPVSTSVWISGRRFASARRDSYDRPSEQEQVVEYPGLDWIVRVQWMSFVTAVVSLGGRSLYRTPDQARS